MPSRSVSFFLILILSEYGRFRVLDPQVRPQILVLTFPFSVKLKVALNTHKREH